LTFAGTSALNLAGCLVNHSHGMSVQAILGVFAEF